MKMLSIVGERERSDLLLHEMCIREKVLTCVSFTIDNNGFTNMYVASQPLSKFLGPKVYTCISITRDILRSSTC